MDERRLILAVCAGPDRGRKAALRPGEALRVGRSERAGLAVPRDGRMSAAHFELQWDGARARLLDLQSAGGTQLNGEPVTGAEVPHGGWIRAGETNFTVHVEAFTPAPAEEDEDDEGDEGGAPAEAPDDDPPFPAEEAEGEESDLPIGEDEEQRWNRRQAAREARRLRAAREAGVAQALPILTAAARQAPLHAILDAARTPRILEVLREAVEDHRSLYEGVEGEALDDVAPYLVRLDAGSRLLGQLVREGWMRRWGIFAEGDVPRRDLRRHLRRFLLVEDDETRERLYFRYYDPGVLRAFWPTCSRRQLEDLIGPLRAFLVEGDRGEVLRLTASGKVEPWSGPA
ncbi:MAG: DUF4123 domain-containing protein [Polyangiaceae bacterium]|nr:DUF4123 domain-containing protein [Polyangiaceae bacterium]